MKVTIQDHDYKYSVETGEKDSSVNATEITRAIIMMLSSVYGEKVICSAVDNYDWSTEVMDAVGMYYSHAPKDKDETPED